MLLMIMILQSNEGAHCQKKHGNLSAGSLSQLMFHICYHFFILHFPRGGAIVEEQHCTLQAVTYLQ